MAARKEKTKTPGIYRRGSVYTFTYTDRLGRQRWGSARTYDEARLLKGRLHRASGAATREGFVAYLRAWAPEYTRAREETRTEYLADIDRWVAAFFPDSLKLADVDPKALHDFIRWLVRQPNGRGATLSDSRIRNILNPVRSALRDAAADGLIDHNPALGLRLPARPTIEDDDDDESDRRAMTLDELELVLDLVHHEWRLALSFLAVTGLRASEFLGLEVRHLRLDGDSPHVRVRQRLRGDQPGPLKSRHARRDLPLDDALVGRLRAHTRSAPARQPVFLTPSGARPQRDNVRNRVIAPAAQEAGVPWVGWHSFRHTCASLMFARGDNLLAVSRFLGHHSPSFTLETYVHLFDADRAAPLALPSMAASRLPDAGLARHG